MIPLSAQISALHVITSRASPHNLKRGGFIMRPSEAELLRERLEAALATLEKLSVSGQANENSAAVSRILWGD